MGGQTQNHFLLSAFLSLSSCLLTFLSPSLLPNLLLNTTENPVVHGALVGVRPPSYFLLPASLVSHLPTTNT